MHYVYYYVLNGHKLTQYLSIRSLRSFLKPRLNVWHLLCVLNQCFEHRKSIQNLQNYRDLYWNFYIQSSYLSVVVKNNIHHLEKVEFSPGEFVSNKKVSSPLSKDIFQICL